MAQYDCDDATVQHELERTVATVNNYGGRVDPATRFWLRNGNLAITVAGAPSDRFLIRVPQSALLPVDGLGLRAEGDHLVAQSAHAQLTPVRRQLLERMLTIYNRTGKLAAFERLSPATALTAPPGVREQLLAGRGAGVAERFRWVDTHSRDGYLAAAFLKTRTLSFLPSNDQQRFPVLMPLIDFANHDFRGPPFANVQGIGIQPAQPVPGSTECRVRYGLYDSFDALVHYGFVDRSAPFLRSVPFEIDVGSAGRLRCLCQVQGPKKGKLAPAIKDLRLFLPTLRHNRDDGVTEVSHLLVPDAASPRALRRILAQVVQSMAPGLEARERRALVAHVERQVIAENNAYYRRLLATLDAVTDPPAAARPVLAMVREMAGVQIARLGEYEAAVGIHANVPSALGPATPASPAVADS